MQLPPLLRVVIIALAVHVAVAVEPAVPSAYAQDRDEQPVLPDLAPREVEIRGQLQIAFPSLQRQPLVGFNPPPRVPDIPPTRSPIIEDYADAGARITRTDLQPPSPPSVAALTGEGPFTGVVELGTGRYFRRIVHGRATANLQGGHRVNARIEYDGSDGSQIDAVAGEFKNKSDDFYGLIQYQKSSRVVTFGAALEGFVTDYTLYGLDTTGTFENVLPNAGRDGGYISESAWIASAPGSGVSYRLRLALEQTKFTSDLFPPARVVDPSAERLEKRGSLQAEVAFPASQAELFIAGRGESAGLDDGSLIGSDVRHGEVSAGARYLTDNLVLAAGGRILAVEYDADVAGLTGDKRQVSYFSPDFELRFRAGERITFFASNRPHVARNGLADLFSRNPYLLNEPSMQPSIMSISAETGIALFSGPLQIKAVAGLQRSPNWAYIVSSSGSGAASAAEGFFATRYEDARIISLGSEVALSLPAELQMSASLSYRDHELVDLDTSIPNEASITGQFGLSYPFAKRRGIVQVTGRFLGSRHADIAQTIDLDPYLDIDVYTRYNISNSVGVTFRVENIGPEDSKIWRGYPQSPLIFSGGIRFLW